ncbi:MAG: FAD-binding domain-containing protein [Pseudomonadota bacterium]
MVTILWYKRDLRIADHPALTFAAELGAPILPLYIVEPGYWALPDTSARQWAFIAECLAGLRKEAVPLTLRVGEAVQVLTEIANAHAATALLSHEETGNGWSYARDLQVAAWARDRGLPWHELPQSGVVRRLKSRDGWAARRERWLKQPMPDTPLVSWAGPGEGTIPSVGALKLRADLCPERQQGGRRAATEMLDSFLTVRGQSYRRAMSSPVEAEHACSRLSPHLALGTLSVREAAQAAQQRKEHINGTRDGWTGSLSSFTSRLAWRDHFMQKLEDAPQIETHCLHSAYETLRPREPDAVRLAAWCAGETGMPFVDACMRYLQHTGWLNFRMRSMLMAVASYHLWLDWRPTGQHLARVFTDYEPGIHWSQTQMQSGTTGMNTVRIYNPIKQGKDQDPTGVFTRRWVPELAHLPDAHLQEPWTWEGAGQLLGKRYPEPLVDVAAAAKAARQQVWAVRRGDAYWAEADRIVTKHASRKRDRGFQRDPDPRKRRSKQLSKAPPDQLQLDL